MLEINLIRNVQNQYTENCHFHKTCVMKTNEQRSWSCSGNKYVNTIKIDLWINTKQKKEKCQDDFYQKSRPAYKYIWK